MGRYQQAPERLQEAGLCDPKEPQFNVTSCAYGKTKSRAPKDPATGETTVKKAEKRQGRTP